MPFPICGGQDHFVTSSHNFEIDSRVTANDLDIILTFNCKDPIAAARKQVFRDGLLFCVLPG